MINVTKTYLPPFEDYISILKRAWDKGWITNNGELVQELEVKLKEFFQVSNLLFCSNGTIVLQMALKALNITKEVITTPFSYVATTNAILWEGCKPVFVDIDPNTFCIDASKIEAAITPETEAILATHVYGIPCDVEHIDAIAKKYNLKVIYDGAHAFGVTINGRSVFTYGNISTCSFHATKLFHTVEGGSISCNNDETLQRLLYLYRQFGHEYDDYYSIGVNAKNSEFHAAMGLAVLPRVRELIQERKSIVSEYYNLLCGADMELLDIESFQFEWNYSYFPILFKDEQTMLRIKNKLACNEIYVRRYFYPSLNCLPFLSEYKCTNSEDVSSRVLCLPLYNGLNISSQTKICKIVQDNM